MRSIATFLTVLLAAAVPSTVPVLAHADGPTGESEAIASMYTGRSPMTLSADGKWLFHIGAHNVLHRKRIGANKTFESIKLPGPIEELSASRAGEQVAFIMKDYCVGIVTFSRTASQGKVSASMAPTLDWVYLKPDPHADQRTCPGNWTDEKYADLWSLYNPCAVALSSDATKIAIAGYPIRIVDTTSGQTIRRLPSAGTAVLHLRFMDADNKLLVVNAIMGERWESAAGPSDMQFAVWDLKNEELFSFHNTKTTGSLMDADLQWSFSEATGELWAINTNGGRTQPDPKRPGHYIPLPIRPHAVNLKRCGTGLQVGPTLPGRGKDGPTSMISFAADPMGRYVAGVTPSFNDKTRRLTSTVWVVDNQSGKSLAQWRLNEELHSLTPSQDGSKLYGITAGQPIAMNGDNYWYREGWEFSGGGQLMTFNLSGKLNTLQPRPTSAWSEHACPIEDEDPQARDIAIDTTTATKIFEVELMKEDLQMRCRIEQEQGDPGTGQSNIWRQLNDGTLYVDRLDTIDRINTDNGKVVERIPTPRTRRLIPSGPSGTQGGVIKNVAATREVCSLALYEQRQFLSWQGDTISLRPFAASLSSTKRKVLISKPGWTATDVSLRGRDQIAVSWVDNRYIDNDQHEEGTALAALYALSGKKLYEVPGNASSGQAHFFSSEASGEDVFANSPVAPLFDDPTTAYRWESSYISSIRARLRSEKPEIERTVLWDGFRFGARSAQDETAPARVFGLGGSIGAQIRRDSIAVYDAASRHRIVLFEKIEYRNLPNPGFILHTAWNPVDRLLMVDAVEYPSTSQSVRKLTAYRID